MGRGTDCSFQNEDGRKTQWNECGKSCGENGNTSIPDKGKERIIMVREDK